MLSKTTVNVYHGTFSSSLALLDVRQAALPKKETVCSALQVQQQVAKSVEQLGNFFFLQKQKLGAQFK